MSRSKRFITGLLSSYAAIGVNILYTLASVPLALQYLDKEEFGLWALVTQLSGYLMLLEFGMNGSVARSLTDHKDHIEDGAYGSILRTGARVFAIQGALVALLGTALAWFTPSFLGIPFRLQITFTILMTCQALLCGARLSLLSLCSPLWCHQRLDLNNLAGIANLMVTFTVLWVGFHLDFHLYSLILSTIAGSAVSSIMIYIFCRKLGFYPSREHRGKFDPKIFRELWRFGSGLFLMNLGIQLASSSQIILVSRIMGIETATIWSIATKIFSLSQQFVARVLDSSAASLSEMYVRNESKQLQKRFHDLVTVSAIMAVAASAGIALMNGPFIEIWTNGKVTWNPWNNLLLAGLLFSSALTRSHTILVGITKQVQRMKFVCLMEGLAFVFLGALLIRNMGLMGLLIASSLCNISITGTYGTLLTARYFDLSIRSVLGWIMRPAGALLFISLIFIAINISSIAELSPRTRFSIGLGIFNFVTVPILWKFCMSLQLRREFHSLIFKFFANYKKKIQIYK